MTDDRPLPTAEIYRGVKVFGLQPAERIKGVVRPAIDAVFLMTDARALVKYAAEASNPPEARLFAAARTEALWQLAAEGRALRPPVDLDYLRAATAGLDSMHWVNPRRHGSLFDRERTVARDVPLTDQDLERHRCPLTPCCGCRQATARPRSGKRPCVCWQISTRPKLQRACLALICPGSSPSGGPGCAVSPAWLAFTVSPCRRPSSRASALPRKDNP